MAQQETVEGGFEHAAALQRARRYGEAVEIYRSLARSRLTVNLAINLGMALAELGQFEEAEHWLGLAARNRASDPFVRRQLGGVHASRGKFDLAELEYRTALAFKPDDRAAQLALAGLLLTVGRYAEGWPLLEARTALHPGVVPPVAVPYPEWRGEPLGGKAVLVWVEQGFGDQIQFSRFANSLKARGASRVTLACRPQLAHLFSTLAGADAVLPVAAKTRAAVPAHDYWTRYFSLPGWLGVTLENLPSAPYLAAPEDRRARWRGAKGVGLAWQASPTGFNAANKGLAPNLAQRLLDAGAISLDPADSGADDFADTAAIVEQLDLVISIDTSVAHLAGAMGKPCWTLIPAVHADWRWMRGRMDSPWYPSMRLYRQATPGDWGEVVERVLGDWRG